MQPADKVEFSLRRDDAASINQYQQPTFSKPDCISSLLVFKLPSNYFSEKRSVHHCETSTAMADPQQIVIQPMTQQLLVQKAGEDWTGVTSSAERRKLQNRLNKRSQCR
jgi:hypothetical protein